MNINNHDAFNLPRGPNGGHIHPSKRFVTFSKNLPCPSKNTITGFDPQIASWDSKAMHLRMTGQTQVDIGYGSFSDQIEIVMIKAI